MEYGLIGEKLGHSASKEIHEQLADYSYELHPLTKEAVSYTHLDVYKRQVPHIPN